MNPSDYRRDYAAYRSAVERERFDRHAGISRHLDLQPVEERYSDLWTRGAIDELLGALEATPEQFETERAGLGALVGAARLKLTESAASEVADELGRCAESARVEWGGEKLSAEGAAELLARERDAVRRRELARRRFDALRSCDDLRATRLAALGDAARSLGFEGRGALYESYTGVSLKKLADEADAFLERTEGPFMTRLSRWAAGESAAGAHHNLEQADQFYFARAAHLDSYFPAQNFRGVYAETLAGLGVRAESQKNLSLDLGPRPAKLDSSACFAVKPPEDVRLVVGPRLGGVDFYLQAFREAGRAQMFAWASREASARYPEFVYAPDEATARAHGALLSGLLRDAGWLARHFGGRATEAQEAAGFASLLELHEARRDCAALRYALALNDGGDARSEQLDELYVSHFGGATGFRHGAATRLLDSEEWFESATRLRARLFAAGLAEHLRGRHGRRWFASRAAGDALIDIWNTASRHPVEELARLVWGGSLDFGLLADALKAGPEGGDGA